MLASHVDERLSRKHGLAKRVGARIHAGIHQQSLRRPQGASAKIKTTGGMSILSACAPATMRVSVARKPCFSIIAASIQYPSKSRVSSTPTTRECTITTAAKSELSYKPIPSDDIIQRNPDISLAQENLGWVPTAKLEVGLEKTISYFENLLALRFPS